MIASPPDVNAQLRAFVAERTGLSDAMIVRVFASLEEFWREREPELLIAMNARLDAPRS